MKTFFWILFTFFASSIFSQIPDSLTQLFKTANSNEKIDKGLDYTQAYLLSDLELAMYCAENTYLSAEKLKESTRMALALDNLGEVNRKLGNYPQSIDFFQKSARIKISIGADTLLHLSYNLLGKTYYNIGIHDSAVYYFIRAAEEMDKAGNFEGKAYYLNNVGVIFDMQGLYDKALEYYFKSLEIKRQINLTDAFAASYTNIGIALFNLGRVTESLQFHEQALQEHQKRYNEEGMAKAYNNIGFAQLELENFELALANFNESLKIRKSQKESRGEAQTENNIAMVYLRLNELDSAVNHNRLALTIALQIGEKNILKEIYAAKAEIYEKREDFREALMSYKLYVQVADSLNHSDAYASMAEMEAKYNVVQKEKEIVEKNYELGIERFERDRQNNLRVLYASISLGLLISCFFFVVAYLRKRRIADAVKGQNLLIQKEINQLERIKAALLVELADKKELLDKAFNTKGSQDLPDELLQLSKREVEVLACLALGWTDQQIADKLFVSKATVKTHLRRIYTKLLVNNRSGAVAIAHKYQIIGQIDHLQLDAASN